MTPNASLLKERPSGCGPTTPIRPALELGRRLIADVLLHEPGHYHTHQGTLVGADRWQARWELVGCQSSPLVDHMVVVDAETLRRLPAPSGLRSAA